ncbi:transcriptional regulator [Sphingomonas paucimobilis]|uniref:transcriptional regulator n=1 Tax=Sphingomonas paucimobilis TaxID=13689 RepID=UPI0030FCACB3
MAIEHESDSALAKAIRAAGSQSAFGRLIKTPQPTVNGWLKRKAPLPAEHVLLVEERTGVSRHELRPDLYPRHEAMAAPSAPPLIGTDHGADA